MAIRFDASGESFTASLGLGSVTDYTVCAWLFVAVDRNSWSTAWSLDNGTGDVDVLQTGEDGTAWGLYSDGGPIAITSTVVGTWYFIGISRAGSGGTAYYRADGAPSLSTVNLAGSSATTNLTNLRLGDSPWTGEWLNGRLAAWKLWTAALSQAEIEAEAGQYDAVRTTNLAASFPFIDDTLDDGPNGYTLSGGNGTAFEAGPAELEGGPTPVESGGSSLPLTVTLSGAGTVPTASVPAGGSSLAVSVALSGAGSVPEASVPQGGASLGLTVTLTGAGSVPAAGVPSGGSSLPVTLGLAGAGSVPAATVPSSGASLAVSVGLSGAGESPGLPAGGSSLDALVTLSGSGSVPAATVEAGSASLTLTVALTGAGPTDGDTIGTYTAEVDYSEYSAVLVYLQYSAEVDHTDYTAEVEA